MQKLRVSWHVSKEILASVDAKRKLFRKILQKLYLHKKKLTILFWNVILRLHLLQEH